MHSSHPYLSSIGTSVEGHLQFIFPDSDDEYSSVNEDEFVEIPTSCFSHQDDKQASSYKMARIKRMGGISIDMCNFQSIGEVESATVKVGAGVTRNTLNEALR